MSGRPLGRSYIWTKLTGGPKAPKVPDRTPLPKSHTALRKIIDRYPEADLQVFLKKFDSIEGDATDSVRRASLVQTIHGLLGRARDLLIDADTIHMRLNENLREAKTIITVTLPDFVAKSIASASERKRLRDEGNYLLRELPPIPGQPSTPSSLGVYSVLPDDDPIYEDPSAVGSLANPTYGTGNTRFPVPGIDNPTYYPVDRSNPAYVPMSDPAYVPMSDPEDSEDSDETYVDFGLSNIGNGRPGELYRRGSAPPPPGRLSQWL